MTGAAFRGRWNVTARERRRTDSGMAAAAHALGCRRDRAVIHPLRTERDGRMTCVAVVVGRNVVGGLAHCYGTVVAAEAAAPRRRVIHSDERREVEQ